MGNEDGSHAKGYLRTPGTRRYLLSRYISIAAKNGAYVFQRVVSSDNAGKKKAACHFESLHFSVNKRKLNAYLADFESLKVGNVKLPKQTGVEFLYVLEGKLGLYAPDRDETLAERESAYLVATVLHGYRRIGRSSCRALFVSVP